LKQKKEAEDKRNLGMAKEGLLNEENWIHKTPAPSKQQMELRQRLFMVKDKALKASTNLFVSKTRLQIRNLPRRDFFEAELKELMVVVSKEWAKTLTKQEKKEKFTNKKLVTHTKIMRDEQKQDAETGNSLPSGQGFVEFSDEDLALYAVHYLNNLQVVATKGLIVDFSMEDQRVLFKRKEKIERWRKIAKEKREEERKENLVPESDEPLDLGAKRTHSQKE
jgi:RNA recognition motif-containing protein